MPTCSCHMNIECLNAIMAACGLPITTPEFDAQDCFAVPPAKDFDATLSSLHEVCKCNAGAPLKCFDFPENNGSSVLFDTTGVQLGPASLGSDPVSDQTPTTTPTPIDSPVEHLSDLAPDCYRLPPSLGADAHSGENQDPPPKVDQPALANSPICAICLHDYHRADRARACENKHRELNPYHCGGVCGVVSCQKMFSSKEQKWKHAKTQCTGCGKLQSNGNMARHVDKFCPGPVPIATAQANHHP